MYWSLPNLFLCGCCCIINFYNSKHGFYLICFIVFFFCGINKTKWVMMVKWQHDRLGKFNSWLCPLVHHPCRLAKSLALLSTAFISHSTFRNQQETPEQREQRLASMRQRYALVSTVHFILTAHLSMNNKLLNKGSSVWLRWDRGMLFSPTVHFLHSSFTAPLGMNNKLLNRGGLHKTGMWRGEFTSNSRLTITSQAELQDWHVKAISMRATGNMLDP